MPAQRLVVREISWRDVFPWLIIFRTFGLAISMPVLFLATIGALLTPVGWQVGEWLFVSEEISQWPGQRGALPVPDAGQFPTSFEQILRHAVPPFQDSVEPVFQHLVYPFAQLLDADLSAGEAAYYAFGGLWMLLVWGFFGGAITRMAVVKLGREERISLGEAVSHARRRLLPYIASPIFPMLGIVLTAIPIFLLGLLMRMDWGVLVAGILWILVLLGGLIITILSVGLLFGWPLMWGTISSEREGDAFEAFSRSYSYTFQRPIHYLFYALLATVFGGFCWLLVYQVSESVIAFSFWPASLGAGADRWAEIQLAMGSAATVGTAMESAATGSGLMAYGALLLGLFASLVRIIATGFGYGFFWCLTAAIYLLLRRDTDQTEFDEVFVENEDRRYQLPELTERDAPAAAPEEAGEQANDQ
jgi:hypothetical protein